LLFNSSCLYGSNITITYLNQQQCLTPKEGQDAISIYIIFTNQCGQTENHHLNWQIVLIIVGSIVGAIILFVIIAIIIPPLRRNIFPFAMKREKRLRLPNDDETIENDLQQVNPISI